VTRQRQVVGVIVALVIAAVILFAIDRVFHNEMFPVAVGTEAPQFRAVTLDSVPKQKSLDDYRGQVVLLNVWATWCLPCRVEMPSIEKLHQAYGPKGLKIVAVSIDDPGTDAQIRDFVKAFRLTFEILHDPKNVITDDYQLGGYPETFVIGRDGIIRKKVIEATDWNSPENRALIERLLAEKAE
jgi:cytochrome c biogenesis protein CcmG, thiol:disulfide interchange protein DsbE